MDFGISYFIVKFDKSKKEELLGISRTHMSKFDLVLTKSSEIGKKILNNNDI